MTTRWQALSIKQPWAALIVHGIKSIEVRSWTTSKRGPILIHASKTPEDDPAAWEHVATTEVMTTAGLVGGFLGIVDIAGCKKYGDRAAFDADYSRHCVRPSRFQTTGLYGFELAKPRRIEFLPAPGFTSIFGVDCDPKPIAAVPKQKPKRSKKAVLKYIVRLPEERPSTA